MVAVAASAAIMGGVAPAMGSDDAPGGPLSQLGGFAVGSRFEAAIDERDGSLAFTTVVAGLTLRWDSREDDAYSLGAGWSWGLPSVDTRGGVRITTPAGRVVEVDQSAPSGLAGYDFGDLRFVTAPETLPARPDGAVAEQPAAFRLHELGGTTTWYSAEGDPLMRTDAHGNRTDLRWHPDETHRLVEIVDADGIATRLDWQDGTVIVQPAANAGPGVAVEGPQEASGAPSDDAWRLELGDGLLTSIVDPLGQHTHVQYGPNGLVSSLTAPSGATTHVSWQRFDDLVDRIDTVRLVDETGAELDRRAWSRSGAALDSGWPAVSDDARYATVLDDGATRVVSSYWATHLLAERRLDVVTPSGVHTAREHRFEYPDHPAGGTAATPPAWSRPIAAQVSYLDDRGTSRTAEETYRFDDLGRIVERTTSDGTHEETTYDGSADVVQPGPSNVPPIGLTVRTRTVASDGSTTEQRNELDAARTHVVGSETWTGTGHELVRTARTDFDVEADGFVSAERVSPAGDTGMTPIETKRSIAIDVARGIVTTTETVAAGTAAASTRSAELSIRPGAPARLIAPTGAITVLRSDRLGRAVEQIDGAGRRTTIRYQSAELHGRNATITTGADGVVRTETRDAIGRVLALADNIDGGVAVAGHERVAERRSYPRPGVTERTDAWGAASRTTVDVYGRLIELRGPDGVVHRAAHDDVAGEVRRSVVASGSPAPLQTTVSRHDASGRVVHTSGVRADGEPMPAVSSVYDGFGRIASTSDGTIGSRLEYDAAGNVLAMSWAPDEASARVSDDPRASTRAERRLDPIGRSLEKIVTDGTGASVSAGTRELDVLGRTLQETDAAGRVTRYEYTVDGLPALAVDSSGRRTVTSYDPVTRAVRSSEVIPSDGGAAVRTVYEYDAAGERVEAVFDAADPSGTRIEYTYDAHGGITRVRYPDGNTLRHTYDRHGRRASSTDIAGRVTEFAYDAAGRLVDATQTEADGRPVANIAYEYDEYGRVAVQRRGDGVRTDATYTSANQIAGERTTNAQGDPISDRAYRYDPRGDLVERADTVHLDARTSETRITEYEYDERHRLVRSTVRGDAASATGVASTVAADTTTEYVLGVSGDILHETVTRGDGTGDGSSTTRSFEHSATGELIGITADDVHEVQQFDARGNLVRSVDGTVSSYDAADRLIGQAYADGSRAEISYWADGARRQRTDVDPDGATRTVAYHWSDGVIANETHAERAAGNPDDAGDRTTTSYLHGLARAARTVGDGDTGTAYYIADRHGSTTELTDQSGAIIERYHYSDYGVTLERAGAHAKDTARVPGAERNPFRYSGEYTDPDGSQMLGERIYQPAAMHFTSRDDAGLLNDFAYANLNPITMIDPTGRTAQTDGLGMSVAGLALSVAGFASALATAGTSLIAFGLAAVAGFDVLASALEAVNLAHPFMSDQAAVALGGTALALGIGAGLAGAAKAASSLLDARRAVADPRLVPLLGDEVEGAPSLNLQGEGGLSPAMVPDAIVHQQIPPTRSGGAGAAPSQLATYTALTRMPQPAARGFDRRWDAPISSHAGTGLLGNLWHHLASGVSVLGRTIRLDVDTVGIIRRMVGARITDPSATARIVRHGRQRGASAAGSKDAADSAGALRSAVNALRPEDVDMLRLARSDDAVAYSINDDLLMYPEQPHELREVWAAIDAADSDW